jgi:hypothetical protein
MGGRAGALTSLQSPTTLVACARSGGKQVGDCVTVVVADATGFVDVIGPDAPS